MRRSKSPRAAGSAVTAHTPCAGLQRGRQTRSGTHRPGVYTTSFRTDCPVARLVRDASTPRCAPPPAFGTRKAMCSCNPRFALCVWPTPDGALRYCLLDTGAAHASSGEALTEQSSGSCKQLVRICQRLFAARCTLRRGGRNSPCLRMVDMLRAEHLRCVCASCGRIDATMQHYDRAGAIACSKMGRSVDNI